METEKSSNKALIGIIIVVLLVAATTAVIVFASSSKNDTAQTTSSQMTSSSPAVSSTASTATTGSFKDGTYTATGRYQTPGGQESIGVSLTLAGGTITSATVTQNASGGEAEEYQSAFASGFKSQVVGKKITDVSLNSVAGSSLTPNGFNSAVTDIEKQAAA